MKYFVLMCLLLLPMTAYPAQSTPPSPAGAAAQAGKDDKPASSTDDKKSDDAKASPDTRNDDKTDKNKDDTTDKKTTDAPGTTTKDDEKAPARSTDKDAPPPPGGAANAAKTAGDDGAKQGGKTTGEDKNPPAGGNAGDNKGNNPGKKPSDDDKGNSANGAPGTKPSGGSTSGSTNDGTAPPTGASDAAQNAGDNHKPVANGTAGAAQTAGGEGRPHQENHETFPTVIYTPAPVGPGEYHPGNKPGDDRSTPPPPDNTGGSNTGSTPSPGSGGEHGGPPGHTYIPRPHPGVGGVDSRPAEEMTSRSELLVTVGNGGKYDAKSVAVDYLFAPHNGTPVLFGIGASALFTESDRPPDLIESPTPHGNYHTAGEFRDTAYAVYGIVAHPLAKGLTIRGFAGISQLRITTITQSDITGWYYEDGRRSETTFLMGGGISYRGFTASYDNVRGLMLGMEIPLK